MSDPNRCQRQHCRRCDEGSADDTSALRSEVRVRELITWLQPSDGQPSGAGAAVPVHTRIVFDPSVPWELVIEFRTSRGGRISWLIGRALLRQGLNEEAGISDVKIGPLDHTQLRLTLSSPSGAATFALDRAVVEEVLERSYRAVPAAQEFDGLDVDAEAAQLAEGPHA